jgi:hypothetical protein
MAARSAKGALNLVESFAPPCPFPFVSSAISVVYIAREVPRYGLLFRFLGGFVQ